MSTRANVIIEEKGPNGEIYGRLYFYRHSDGYPEGVEETLNKMCDWIKRGVIRNNLSQGSGWLIALGAIEYNKLPAFETEKVSEWTGATYGRVDTIEDPKDWKVGAYEPTDQIHGDVQHVYLLDISAGKWSELKKKDWHKYSAEEAEA